MTWQQVRNNFPQQWLLIEAIEAHTEENQRLLDRISVVEPFEDSGIAWSRYAELHRESPEREFYVIHTSREEPNITERKNDIAGFTVKRRQRELQGISLFVSLTNLLLAFLFTVHFFPSSVTRKLAHSQIVHAVFQIPFFVILCFLCIVLGLVLGIRIRHTVVGKAAIVLSAVSGILETAVFVVVWRAFENGWGAL